jgi:hypothetical protein
MPTIRLPAVDTRPRPALESRDVRGFTRYMIRPDYQLFITSRP